MCSRSLATVLTGLLIQKAAVADPFLATGFTLLATLAALGLIEHWFLVVPLPVAGLWSWGLRAHEATQAVSAQVLPASRLATQSLQRQAADTAAPRTISTTSLVA